MSCNSASPLLAKLKAASVDVDAARQSVQGMISVASGDQRGELLRLLAEIEVIHRSAAALGDRIRGAEALSDVQYDDFYAKIEEVSRILFSRVGVLRPRSAGAIPPALE